MLSLSRILSSICDMSVSLSPFRVLINHLMCLLESSEYVRSSLLRQIVIKNIHLIRHTNVFSPSRISGTMTSADSLYIAVARLSHPYKVSWDKPLLFPRLPSQFTHWSYDCLLDFALFCKLIHPIRLRIVFLFVGLRFRYCFFYSLLTENETCKSLDSSLATTPIRTFTLEQ